MKIPLPNLDDRRWSDLVDEGRSLIPTYAPEWTDHNVHDPGITVMELLAWIAEMDIYQLNRISDEHKRKFLALVGIMPEPPRAAQTVLSFVLKPGIAKRELIAGTQFVANDPSGLQIPFRLLDPIAVVSGRLETVQIKDRNGLHDVGNRLLAGESVPIFGAIPELGAEVYFGFSESLAPDTPISLHFKFAGAHSAADERRRILDEIDERLRACCPPSSEITCEQTLNIDDGIKEKTQRVPRNNRVRTSWEFLTRVGTDLRWQPLQPADLEDDTCAFTLDGRVLLRIHAPMEKKIIGQRESYYIRCRFEAGAYDAPAYITAVALNGALSEQAVPVSSSLIIAKNAAAIGIAPLPGQQTGIVFNLETDAFTGLSEITRISFVQDPEVPKFTVLAYEPPSPVKAGSLTLEAVFLGSGDGSPDQQLKLPQTEAQQSSLGLFSMETSGTPAKSNWRRWSVRQDFDTSKRPDAHFLLDATRGIISFGDGEKGRTPPAGALIFAVYNSTQAEAGNLPGHETVNFIDGPYNRAFIASFDNVVLEFQEISNAISGTAGAPAETLDAAATRAIKLVSQTNRAVTLKDYERLAMATPGTQLARAEARANRHPSFPCLKATGLITLVILPSMPVARPTPSFGLRRTVASYLQHKRVIGTRVEVVGPDYLEVSIQAKVKAFAGVARTNLQQKIVTALNNYLHPLTGGPKGTGWPIGRDLYRSEIMQLIDEVVGVDNVIQLELISDGCGPQCGNICLGPTSLIAAGNHVIEVI